MDIFLMKAVADCFWYLAVFFPVLLRSSGIVRALLVLIPAAWLVWLAFNWKRRRMVSNAFDIFWLEFRFLMGIGFFELIFLGVGGWNRECAPFAALFFVSGILMLRTVRLMNSDQERGCFWKENGRQFLVILAVTAGLASKTMRNLIGQILVKGYQTLILPVLIGILDLLVGFLMWIWPYLAALFPGLASGKEEGEMAEITAGPPLDLSSLESRETPFYLKLIGIGLIVLAAGAFFFCLYRRFSKAGNRRHEKMTGEISRSIMEPERRRMERFWLHGEKDVRYYYRKFLELCIRSGFGPEPHNTTEDIHRAAAKRWREEELLKLRALYLEARYGTKKESGQERKRAKELYRFIKAEEKGREEKGYPVQEEKQNYRSRY